MYNTIIFDLDGTLLNTIEDLADSVNYMQRKYGLKEDSVRYCQTACRKWIKTFS